MRLFRKKNGSVDWLTIIPLAFWAGCFIISIAKIFQSAEGIPSIFDILNSFNENTFSTFITMVIALAYQYFSKENTVRSKNAGLSREHISCTIVSTIFYGVVAIINACRYNHITIVIMAVISLIYVILYFTIMRD